jgi:hypothetical protein
MSPRQAGKVPLTMMARDGGSTGGVADVSVIAISDRLEQARTLLTKPATVERSAPALGAALLAAVTALLLAGAVILGPGVEASSSTAATSAR